MAIRGLLPTGEVVAQAFIGDVELGGWQCARRRLEELTRCFPAVRVEIGERLLDLGAELLGRHEQREDLAVVIGVNLEEHARDRAGELGLRRGDAATSGQRRSRSSVFWCADVALTSMASVSVAFALTRNVDAGRSGSGVVNAGPTTGAVAASGAAAAASAIAAIATADSAAAAAAVQAAASSRARRSCCSWPSRACCSCC